MKSKLMVIATFAIALQGCVMGRRTLELNIPASELSVPTRGRICVTSVLDHRVFQNKPKDPSVPSVDGDVNELSADQKAIMIGRQRNGYGMALGDIALPRDDSVLKRTKILVEEALKRRGYEVTGATNASTTAAVSIDQFWAWFTPGMWSIDFEARVNCTVTLSRFGNNSRIVVQGYGMNHGQFAKDSNWQEAYDRAFKDYLAKFDTELKRAGW